jgi:two-component system chemotaxis response regulator CheY
LKALVVDDSKFSLKMTTNLLRQVYKNIDIQCADNGYLGFDIYKETNPDFVLVDLLMPGISGKELIKMIFDYDKNAKILVLSADVQEKVRKEVLDLGVIGFINKPFNVEKAEKILDMVGKCSNE